MDERLAFGYGIPGRAGEAAPPAGRPAAAVADERSGPISPAPLAESGRTDWAFVGLMAFTALLFLRPQDSVPFLRSVPLADIAALFALASMAAGRLGRGLPVTRITPELVGVLALGGVMLAMAPFSAWPGGAIGTFTGMYAKVVLIFLLMVNTLTSPRRVERFIWLIVLASGYLSARAVFDYARGVNLIEYGRVQGSVGGMFRNPNDLALNMVTVLPLSALLALRPQALFRRAVAAFCGVMMVGAIVASQSRSGTVGLAAMIVLLGILVVRHKPGLVAAALLAGLLASPLAPASYWERVASITNKDLDQTGSREARSILLRESYAAFLAHPLTGVGAGNFAIYDPGGRQEAWREAHNAVLQVAAELGIFGLLVFVFLLGCAVQGPIQTRRILRRLRRARSPTGRAPAPSPLRDADHEMLTMYTAAALASVFGWFVCAMFASVAYHWTFYYVLAIAVAPRDYLTAHLAAGTGRRRVPAPAPVSAMGARA